ncbi:LexA family protein [Adhaeribacter rhizoryzae]|uniref:Translesion error-prone DNA polymerase V autoproteolytic subunit n=1 Tax=Adhaeribacter rhizoryzae TaxID=2607907 RepID=A0A5M6D7Y7_9BACT|nr:translesion error-prone DNA polymerase V autoproteolytic subunit [Adhaeribacter rhizoryzae]KAA5541969.1 translesion error-prone DNA polymerase V autoproteolytic subunit [Adhaeribacter rhizoryzae]
MRIERKELVNANHVTIILSDPAAEKQFPLFVNLVRAGFPSPAEDYSEERISLTQYLNGNPTATFYVRVEGDSMEDFGLFEGDLLVIDRSLEVRSGDIILANIDNEFTVKKLEISGDGVRLVAGNKKYKSIQITTNLEMLVWGVVRGLARRFRK